MDDKRLSNLLRHIGNVRHDCELLGTKLISQGEEQLGLTLIANGQIHDFSKFFGIEYLHLNGSDWPQASTSEQGRVMFSAAITQHVTTNPHHPEYWVGGIKEMPQVYLAEFVCDCHARSSEQGTDITEWMREKATERFGFTTRSLVYGDIRRYLELLLEKKFT